jgi:shikimate dehydrogenase
VSLRFVLIGHPVAHSLSPAIHGAAYRALGLDHRYDLVDAPDEAAVAKVVDSLRRGEIAGMNVTIPWKRVALKLADRAESEAAAIGAANVLSRAADGAVVATNTDIVALERELALLCKAPRAALVIGSGGAALASVASCRRLGAQVFVVARRFAGDPVSGEGADEFRRLSATPLAWPADSRSRALLEDVATRVDLVVQATSAGMHGADSGESVVSLVPWSVLPASAGAYDLIYVPEETPFLRAARESGRAARGGLGMLVGQARAAIELWLGAAAPEEPLFAAARAALAARRS